MKGGFLKGMGLGVIVGVAAGTAATWMAKEQSGCKKKMGKTIKNIGEVVDNVLSMF